MLKTTGQGEKAGDRTNTPTRILVSKQLAMANEYLSTKETGLIIGIGMEIHNILGRGFSEVVYKDAMAYEFKCRDIRYQREKEYSVKYKEITLPHKFYADFVVFDNIILEIKAQRGIAMEQYAQMINYLAVSGCKIGIILNFGESSLIFKRVIL